MPGRPVREARRNEGLRFRLSGECPPDERCWGYPWQQSADSYRQPADFNRDPLRPWQQQQVWEQAPAPQTPGPACSLPPPLPPPPGRPPVHYSAPAVWLKQADMDLGTPPPPRYAVHHSQQPAAAPPPWQQHPPWQQQHPPWQQQQQPWVAPQVYPSVSSLCLAAEPVQPPLPILPGQQQRKAPPAAPALNANSAAPPGSRVSARMALQPPPAPPRIALQPPSAPACIPLEPPPVPDCPPPPPLPAATPPPQQLAVTLQPQQPAVTPPPPLPDGTPPPRIVAQLLLPNTALPPLPPETPPPAAAAPAEAAGNITDDTASPVVPEFIRQLWKQPEPGQPGECEVAAAPAVHASASLPPTQSAADSSGQVGAAKAIKQVDYADELQQAGGKEDVEEGEIAGEAPAACMGSLTPQLPPGMGLPATTSVSEHSITRTTASNRSCSYRSQQRLAESCEPRQRSRSRGRQSSHTSRSQRERSFSSGSSRSSSRSSSRPRRRSSQGRHHRQHGGSRRHASSHRRRSRSPLRRVGRSEVACKRRPAASAAHTAPRDAQLALTTLVESMSAEAASLHHQLGRLATSDAPAVGGGSGGADCKAGSSDTCADVATAPATSAAAAAGIERQLAALSSKLGQLSLLVQQPSTVARPGELSARESRQHEGMTYLVFDTNVWMDGLAPLRDCWKGLVASRCTSVRFLVPLEVMRELDGLKKCFFRSIFARKAIGKLAEMQGHRALRGQREDERHRGMLRRNDDGILDCLLYFRARGAQVEFVSRDVQMCVRARNEGFLAIGPQQARERLFQRLQNEAAGGAAPAKYPAPPTSR